VPLQRGAHAVTPQERYAEFYAYAASSAVALSLFGATLYALLLRRDEPDIAVTRHMSASAMFMPRLCDMPLRAMSPLTTLRDAAFMLTAGFFFSLFSATS